MAGTLDFPGNQSADAECSPMAWALNGCEFAITMCIETGNVAGAPPRMLAGAPEARAVSRTRKPLPQMRLTVCWGAAYSAMFAVTPTSYQMTVSPISAAALARARACLARLFYGGRTAVEWRLFSNIHMIMRLAPGYSIAVHALRAAIAAGRVPGLAEMRCRRPRAPESRLLYLVCAQPAAPRPTRRGTRGRGGQKKVVVVVSSSRVMILGACGMAHDAYSGVVRRAIVAAGVVAGPRADVDHREAFWPAVGTRATAALAAAQRFVAATPPVVDTLGRALRATGAARARVAQSMADDDDG